MLGDELVCSKIINTRVDEGRDVPKRNLKKYRLRFIVLFLKDFHGFP